MRIVSVHEVAKGGKKGLWENWFGLRRERDGKRKRRRGGRRGEEIDV